MTRTIETDRGDAGARFDLALRRHLTGIRAATRTRIQEWIAGGLASINGAVVRRASARVPFGASLTIVIPAAAAPHRMAAEPLPVDVLFEDEALLAVNKPSGLIVHPSYKHASGSLMNALLWYARRWPEGQRPSLVGRLDKLTSGVVIVAKTRTVHATLQRAWLSTEAHKDYLAVVYGHPPERGDIRRGLARDPADRRRVVAPVTGGAHSVTSFERLSRVEAPHAGLGLLTCRLMTGRMHQIRVHLSASGWPIVGDPRYGEPRWRTIEDHMLAAALRAFPRQALHAWRVRIAHPVTGRAITIEAPVPADMKMLLATAGLTESAEMAGREAVRPPGVGGGRLC